MIFFYVQEAWAFINNIFRYFQIFWKILKKMKMAESWRSLSPNKQKGKHSKLARMATTKTIFKSEWKKEISFITSIPNDFIASKRYSWNCSYYVTFLWYHQMCNISAKYEVWKIMKFGRSWNLFNLLTCSNLNLIAIQSEFCIAGNLSNKIHSISAARFSFVICDKTSKCDHNWI